jgi:hypothetical protein
LISKDSSRISWRGRGCSSSCFRCASTRKYAPPGISSPLMPRPPAAALPQDGCSPPAASCTACWIRSEYRMEYLFLNLSLVFVGKDTRLSLSNWLVFVLLHQFSVLAVQHLPLFAFFEVHEGIGLLLCLPLL